jgi:hypothetical protein
MFDKRQFSCAIIIAYACKILLFTAFLSCVAEGERRFLVVPAKKRPKTQIQILF